VQKLVQDWRVGALTREEIIVTLIEQPGRPDLPEMVQPRNLHRRKISSPEGHAALIHSICHIEFNAINLALDAVYRFHAMPDRYYSDWLQVAEEEALHFKLLSNHLQDMGYFYGDFPAHNGLWEMTMKTAHDPLIRMALVPRVLEARGLDVTPGIINKLESVGDSRAIEILNIIQRDEIGHVEIGTRWFHYLCELRGLDAESTFRTLLEQYMKGPIKGPLDRDARRRAGFSEAELDYLEGVK
jgi:uncharacterized ferritin-like protein (DUF455 family)